LVQGAELKERLAVEGEPQVAFVVGAVAQAAHLLLRTVDDKRTPTQTRTHINTRPRTRPKMEA
jgi:hypothetical protein